jgi:Tfp pilus assembly major pilin PilA
MENKLVLIAVISTIPTIGGTIVDRLEKQNKLAQEAATAQRKEKIERQVDIEANKQDIQKNRSILFNRYPTKPKAPTSEPK